MKLVVHDLARRPYLPTLARQQEFVRQVQLSPAEAHLILVEHNPPVITTGRRDCDEQLLIEPERLAELGIEFHRTSRGGSITYHGPGQLVAYPILALAAAGLSVRQYVHALEDALLATLAQFGLPGRRIDGMTGVWVHGEKIAAIGVAVSKWVTWHGLALNVSTNLNHFDLIVPCGLAGKRATSLCKCLGRDVGVDEVKPRLVANLAKALNLNMEETSASEGDHGEASRESSACMYARPTDDSAFNDARPTGKSEVHRPFPPWLRTKLPSGGEAQAVRRILSQANLTTVCQAANCPNVGDCFSRRTATFMILGATCTRSCRFCGVASGTPFATQTDEPRRVAGACKQLGLRHVVITSVTRDDLPDGGAAQFARTIAVVRRESPQATIEVLTPDFQGRLADVDAVLAASPDVFNHNLETVARLSPLIRPQASYTRSLDVLRHARKRADEGSIGRPVVIKSGLMAGLGETNDEFMASMRDLRWAGCDMLTIGQYLAPSARHAPVARYITPAEFDALAAAARELGFSAVAAGPLVRSSYHAGEMFRLVAEK